jgi:hypothetical protein
LQKGGIRWDRTLFRFQRFKTIKLDENTIGEFKMHIETVQKLETDGAVWYNRTDIDVTSSAFAERVEYKDGTVVYGWYENGQFVEADKVVLPDGTVISPAHLEVGGKWAEGYDPELQSQD